MRHLWSRNNVSQSGEFWKWACKRASLAVSWKRPFLYPLLKMLIDLLQRFLRVPAFIDFFDYAEGIEYAPIMTAERTNIEPYPNSITGFPYEAGAGSLLKMCDLARLSCPSYGGPTVRISLPLAASSSANLTELCLNAHGSDGPTLARQVAWRIEDVPSVSARILRAARDAKIARQRLRAVSVSKSGDGLACAGMTPSRACRIVQGSTRRSSRHLRRRRICRYQRRSAENRFAVQTAARLWLLPMTTFSPALHRGRSSADMLAPETKPGRKPASSIRRAPMPPPQPGVI